jgi:hypothetical protein
LKSGFVLRQRGPPAPGDICGYVHAFLIAQIKPKDAKDNLLRYFKGNPQGGRCKQISLFEKVAHVVSERDGDFNSSQRLLREVMM